MVTTERKPEGNKSMCHMDMWRKGATSRGNCNGRGLDEEPCLRARWG